MLANPIYVGEIRHKQVSHPGQHEPIIEKSLWQRVQAMLKQRATRQSGGASRRTSNLLMGKLFDENGEPLYACGAKKGDRRYRYFVSRKLIRRTDKTRESGWRISAEEIERAVMAAARQTLSDRGALASTLKACGLTAAELKQTLEVVDHKLKSLDEIGSTDTAESVVERVVLKRDGMQITLNLRALLPTSLSRIAELATPDTRTADADQAARRRNAAGDSGRSCCSCSKRSCSPASFVPRYQWFGELASGRVTLTANRSRPRRSEP